MKAGKPTQKTETQLLDMPRRGCFKNRNRNAGNPMKGHMHTIRIDGKEQHYEGMKDDRKGILSEGKIYWMFPAVRYDGGPLEPLPAIGPSEIRRVTTEIPDLTTRYPKTVREIFDKRLTYHKKVTYEKHVERYPRDAWIEPDQFEEARKRIANETLEQFKSSGLLKEMVWYQHPDQELAKQLGLITVSEHALLSSWLKGQGFLDKNAWRETARLKWVAIYNDPNQTKIYLYDLIASPDPKAAEKEMRRREVEAQEKIAAAVAACTQNFGQQLSDIMRVALQLREAQQGTGQKKDEMKAVVEVMATDVKDATAAAKGLLTSFVGPKKQTAVEVNTLGAQKLGGKRAKKRGRKREFDANQDQRLLDGWKAGHFLKYADFAKDKGMKTADVIKALQRARARKRYRQRALE